MDSGLQCDYFILISKDCFVYALEELAFTLVSRFLGQMTDTEVPYPVKERLQDHHQKVSAGCSVITEGNGTLPVLPVKAEDVRPSGHHRSQR